MMEKRERVSKTIVALFIIMVCFVTLQFISPFLATTGSLTDLSGRVGTIDNRASIDAISFPGNLAYLSGDVLCHQKPERSFFINGNQMPFCSRCTAIWVGLMLGLMVTLFYTIELNERFMMFLILSLVPIGIDGTGQLLGFWESTNLSRVITGLLVGIPVGWAMGIISDEIKSLLKSKTN